MIRQWHGRAGRPIKHPARHLQQLKPTIMFERGLKAHYCLSHTGPAGGHLQAKPRMPTVMDLQLGIMCFVSCGCTTIPDHIKRSIRTLPSHEPSNLERKARLSQSLRSVACITGISGQLKAGSVNMFPNTDRRQIQPQESAWREQVDSSE